MTGSSGPAGGDDNALIAERRAKLAALRAAGAAFPNDFRRDTLAGDLHVAFGGHAQEWFDAHPVRVRIAGRMMFKRVMGKASFAKLQDVSGQMQVYLQANALGDAYEDFKGWDVGDIVAAEGTLMRTRAGELSVKAETIRLLTKSLRPLPDKWHGLADTETRYRQRYVDLIVNEDSRNTFRRRIEIVRYLRNFLDTQGFLEVETPMLQQIPGGAAARPFVTHHNALDVDMYLRVAPELFLKRLVVGGFERVYEINRNFRNEGVSTQHNPEFTMLELYQAYADYRDLMELVERLLQGLADTVLGTRQVPYQGRTFDFSGPFRRVSIEDCLLEQNPGTSTAAGCATSTTCARSTRATASSSAARTGRARRRSRCSWRWRRKAGPTDRWRRPSRAATSSPCSTRTRRTRLDTPLLLGCTHFPGRADRADPPRRRRFSRSAGCRPQLREGVGQGPRAADERARGVRERVPERVQIHHRQEFGRVAWRRDDDVGDLLVGDEQRLARGGQRPGDDVIASHAPLDPPEVVGARHDLLAGIAALGEADRADEIEVQHLRDPLAAGRWQHGRLATPHGERHPRRLGARRQAGPEGILGRVRAHEPGAITGQPPERHAIGQDQSVQFALGRADEAGDLQPVGLVADGHPAAQHEAPQALGRRCGQRAWQERQHAVRHGQKPQHRQDAPLGIAPGGWHRCAGGDSGHIGRELRMQETDRIGSAKGQDAHPGEAMMRNAVHEPMLARPRHGRRPADICPISCTRPCFGWKTPWAQRLDSGRIAAMQNEGPKPGSETATEVPASPPPATDKPREIGGPPGPEPTRFGDWEKAGRCIDF
jgi:lysyl-tRNA synthetase